MPEQLLATKFFIPPIRTGLVSRPRLMKTLENALRLPLSIITAPPGFGKTTLITEWLQSVQKSQSTPPHCIAWVSLDPDDNTISRFWKYAITSLQKAAVSAAVPSETGEVLSEVQGMLATSITPYQVFLTQLINEVSGLPFTFILILDDYHVILEPAISESLTYFIDHIPPNLHLILASRTDPPIPTGRWRARGQMIHLRTQDLRFLMEEVTQFFNDSIGLNLSPENVAVLDQRTEGWAAGLQMAAIVLQDKDEMEIANSISAFTGRHHMLLDYFTEEVLSRQPEEVQHFLLQTSILDRMCAELCAALNDTGLTATSSMTTTHAQAMLERLERGNLFVIPLDSERRWYRYHHLFNDLLLTRLRQSIGQQGEAELRRRAAHWHNQQGHLSEAVRMALQAQDFDLAASLIENPAQSIRIWESGEVATILKWIQQLPPQIVQKHLWLRLYESRSMFFTGQAAAGEAILDEIEQAIHANPTGVPQSEVLLGVVLSHRARYASAHGQVKSAILLSQQALEVLPEHEKNARNFVLPTLAYSAYLIGDVEQAARLYSDSVNISRQAGSRFGAIGTLANLARTLLVQGQLQATIQMSRAAIEEGTLQGNRLPVTGWVHFPLAEALYEQNKLAEAEQTLLEGLRLVSEGQLTDYFGLMPALLARIQAASGRLEEAQVTLDAALASTRRSSVAFSASEIEARQAHLWLEQGDIERAVGWAEGYQHQPRSERLNEIEDIMRAEVFLASGRAEEARKLLAAMAKDALARGRFGREITIRVLLALACQEVGDIQESRNHMERALSLAEPEGCLQPFLLLGKPVASLLGTFSSQNPASEQSIQHLRYMKTILAAFSQGELPAPEQWEQKSQPVDPLTPREMDVLRLLAEGLTNREIAARLYLSPNTLRVYTTNLYSKLDVHNRTQAVLRAQELKII